MWKYFGMNRLGEKASWVRFAKKRKKTGEKHQNTAPGGWFYAQTNAVQGTGWCRNERLRSKPQGSQIVQREEPNVLIHSLVFELC
jgi:hypothetical protein